VDDPEEEVHDAAALLRHGLRQVDDDGLLLFEEVRDLFHLVEARWPAEVQAVLTVELGIGPRVARSGGPLVGVREAGCGKCLMDP